MIRNGKILWKVVAMAGLLLGAGRIAAAQSTQSGTGGQSQPASQQPADKSKTPDVTPLTLDAPAPVSADEDAAYKVFHDLSMADASKKVESGETFLQKYPQSRYRSPVYVALVYEYQQLGQLPKMVEYGEKELELAPTDVTTLAMLGQTLPRRLPSNPSEAAQALGKAEKYSKQAIEIAPTLPKPADITDEQFEKAKNQSLAMAHSGLGLVFWRRGKYAEAISELELSLKVDPTPDPVNYYLLGMANKSASHFDDAVAAFNKCAAMGGQMQTPCKNGAEDAKKLGSTQLSAPK
jgi:tetratricopeptide (TPR) repeat protein